MLGWWFPAPALESTEAGKPKAELFQHFAIVASSNGKFLEVLMSFSISATDSIAEVSMFALFQTVPLPWVGGTYFAPGTADQIVFWTILLSLWPKRRSPDKRKTEYS